MRSAFSFIEVIISVVILSFLGVAILNFNSFNKKAMFNNIQKQNTLMITTPFLYIDDKFENNKEYTLDKLLTFKNLSDEDNSFLKSIKLKGDKKQREKLFLYNDGKKDYYLDYSNIKVQYKQNVPLHFISISRPK